MENKKKEIKRIGIEVSHAAALAVKQCDVDVIAAYPITPQTHIVERLADMVADGELDAEFVPVESEHSAMSVCVGASAAGARVFTCTSAQGLILMSEIVFITSAMRLPCVMILANRSLSGPLSIWCDHTDVMSIRDCGWIQIFANTGQEVYDLVFWAYKVAERTLHPVIINMDGFYLTHVVEAIELIDDEMVKRYLPPYKPSFALHPHNPMTMGAYGVPELYTEAKKAQDEALKRTYQPVCEEWENLGAITSRYYKPVETYMTEDAQTLFFTMGSIGETGTVAVDQMRQRGEKVGLIALRLWRPFPFEDLRKAVGSAKRLIVLDRALSYGGPGGPVSSEIRAAFYGREEIPAIYNYIVGLAGRDVRPEDFEQIYREVLLKKDIQSQEDYIIYGVRG